MIIVSQLLIEKINEVYEDLHNDLGNYVPCCGQSVEVPPANVGKIVTKDGYRVRSH